MVGIIDLADEAGDDADPRLLASFLDSILSPIAAIAPGVGPMKAMPAAFSASAKLKCVLGQEAVARDAPPARRSACRPR
jgi:hypothetical protein